MKATAYVSYLSEVGQPVHEACREIEALRQEILEIQKRIDTRERALHRTISRLWSRAEINAAITCARETARFHGRK